MEFFRVFLSTMATVAVAAADAKFLGINGLLCTKPEFVETRHEIQLPRQCAFICVDRQNCQAFTTADGPCQLFVFNKCSKYVRDCNCTRRGQVFVKQQSGLEPGALCPTDYSDNLCGMKYKAYNGINNWNTFKATVQSEPGLVIMADIMDSSELSYVRSLFLKYNMTSAYLGGHQLPGSVEPAGGWQWASCNISISSSLWKPGEPTNGYGGTEHYTSAVASISGLYDAPVNHISMRGSFGECVSPFE